MKIKVKFWFECENKSIKGHRDFIDLQRELKPFRTGEKWFEYWIYCMNQEEEMYGKVVEFCKSKLGLSLITEFTVLCSEEDRQQAVGYLLNLPENYCEEYEDIESGYKECTGCWTREKSGEPFYVQPQGYIKRHEKDYGMAGLDGTGETIILPKLAEKLIEEGISNSYLQPVLSKRKKVRGYIFVTDHILPEGAFVDSDYDKKEICPVCGHIKLSEKEGSIYKFQTKYLKGEAVEHFKDVNGTYEFFGDYRKIIVSKKVEKIIRETMGDYGVRNFIPVFKEERGKYI